MLSSTGDGLMDIFARLGAIRHRSPASPVAQELVSDLQSYITENIDKTGGPGTAELVHKAIEICRK